MSPEPAAGRVGPRRFPSDNLADAIKDSRKLLASRGLVGLGQKFDLGVLLVHGMGEQKRGQTLRTDGRKLRNWIKRRVDMAGAGVAGGTGKVEILDAVKRGAAAAGDELPIYAIVRITSPKGESATWLVAEGWWAESFPPAKYREFEAWARVAGPLVGATQVADIARRLEIGRDIDPSFRLLLIPVRLLIGALMVAVGALAAFGVTALASVARWAPSFQRTLALGHGDAYLFATRPGYRKKMAEKVRADLAAVRGSSRTVAIVAHSMGTGVAWEALANNPSKAAIEPLRLFVTYGQGLRKLFFAREASRRLGELAAAVRAASRFGTIAVSALVLIGVAPFILEPLPPVMVVVLRSAALVGVTTGVLAVILELSILRTCREMWDESAREIGKRWSKVQEVAPKLEWLDLWGSSDPAPVGSLGVETEPGKPIGSYKIRNQAWPPVDHDVYWLNGTEYLPIVLSRLFDLGGPKQYAAPLTDARLKATAMRRHARVHWLVATRVLVAGAFVGWLVAAVVGLRLPPLALLVAIVVLLSLGVTLLRWLGALWQSLVNEDETTYLSGIQQPLWSPAWVVNAALAPLLAIQPAMLLLLLGDGQVGALYLIAVTFTVLVFLTVMSGGGITFGRHEPRESLLAAMDGSPGGAPLAILLTAILVLASPLAESASPGLGGAVLLVEVGAALLVMAYEGLREYQLFRAEFAEQNAKLPPA